jgi:hypothetical protein
MRNVLWVLCGHFDGFLGVAFQFKRQWVMIVSEPGLELALLDFSDKVAFQGLDGFIAFLIIFNFHDKIVFPLSFPIPIPYHVLEQSITILLFQAF